MLGFLRLMERIGTGRPLERQIGFSRVVVKGLLRPEGVVEVEADAVKAGESVPRH
jgi:hypothetical protein